MLGETHSGMREWQPALGAPMPKAELSTLPEPELSTLLRHGEFYSPSFPSTCVTIPVYGHIIGSYYAIEMCPSCLDTVGDTPDGGCRSCKCAVLPAGRRVLDDRLCCR